MEWAEWWGRYLNNLTSGKGRYPANSGITSMWTLWIAWGATGIEITPELFPHTAQLLLLSTTARTKRKHYKDLLWKKWRILRIIIDYFEICILATPKSPPAFMCEELCKGRKQPPTQKGPQLGLKHASMQSEEHLYSTGRQINEEKIKHSQSSKMKTALLSSCTHNKGIYAIASLADVIVEEKNRGKFIKMLKKNALTFIHKFCCAISIWFC